MAKAAGPFVGLDIGSAFVKAVEMSWRGGHPEITAIGVMPTPNDAVIQGLIIDPPQFGAVIRHLLEISGIRSRRVISSLAGANNVTVRIIEVPRMPERELADTMRLEIDRFVPFAHGQPTEKAYQTLPIPAASEANMQVILTVAISDVVTSHIQALKAAGLDPVAIEVEPLAAARSLTGLVENGGPLSDTVGIVNMGAASTELSVVTGGLLVFPRTISIGGDSFTKAVAENLGMRVDTAERMKRQYASIDVDAMAVAQSAHPGGDGMSDFGDFGFGAPEGSDAPPPMFDFNTASAGGGGATPGLNPNLYKGSGSAAGIASVGAEDSLASGSVFDLGETSEDVADLFPTQVSKPKPAAASAPPPLSGFDLGTFGTNAPEPTISPSAGAAGTAGGLGPGNFDLGDGPQSSGHDMGFDMGGFDLGTVSGAGGTTAAEDEEAYTVQQVQEILSPVLGELVTELRRSLEYYRSHNPSLPIARLILCGGSARLPNIDRFLENELGLPVQIANPLATAHVNVPSAPAEWLQDIAPVLAIAVGLGEREMIDVPKDYVPRALMQP